MTLAGRCALTLAVLASGCGTLLNLTTGYKTPLGGVCIDLFSGGMCAISGDAHVLLVPLFALDLPLSLGADLATLPITAVWTALRPGPDDLPWDDFPHEVPGKRPRWPWPLG
jgi:hypothetical protein